MYAPGHRKLIAGISAVVAATVIHGINLCFARLSQIQDILDDHQYMPKLSCYFDPILVGSCLLTLIIGMALIVQAGSLKRAERESNGKSDG